MSMPREDLSSQRPIAGSARFIGRVGALAVALGLGAAIANGPGIAWADTHESDSSSSADSSSTSSASTGSSPSKPQGASELHSRGTKAADEPPGTGPAAAGSTTEPSPVDVTSTARKPKKPGNRTTATSAAVSASTAPSERKSVSDEQPGPHPSTTQSAQVNAAGAAPEATGHPQTSQLNVTRRAVVPDAVPTAAAVPQASVATAPSPPRAPVGLVTGLLSIVGLNPQATTSPVAPPQAPALWTMLGWVRREVGQVVNHGAAATAGTSGVASTSLVVPTVPAVATSPLGTPQQLTAEQTATATVNTLPVQLMKLVLQLGWMNTAKQQFAAVGGPDQANIDQLGDAVDEYAMGAAFQQQLLDSNNPTVVSQVWPGHSWYGQDVGGSRILYDNPDTIYRFMGVNAASSYVITGKFAGGVPADTNFSLLTGLSGVTADNLSGNDLLVNPDGTFTITVDSSPGVPGSNHIQLTSDSTLIAARNTLSDWNNQEPMSLSIQRISGPPDSLFSQLGGFAIPVIGPRVASNPLLTTLVSLIPPLADPPPLLRGAVTAVVMVLGLQMESTYIQVATTDPTTGKPTQPNVMSAPARNAQFLATQLQSAGYFQLANDQALVLTIDPGDAQYFVVPVTNDWTITDNYWDQQTSLNNVQALANPDDGTYTLVISPTDPDVANWVSTGGLNQGTISIRFQDLPLNPTNLPTVTSRVVSLDQLATVLPANTVYVTPAQRQEQIAARKAGFDNRFAPYPQV
jgi:hypothetical protein